MNYFINFLFIAFFYKVTSSTEIITPLIALSSGPYAGKLYRKLGNRDQPHEADSVSSCAKTRELICRDIANSGFFPKYQFFPLGRRKIIRRRNHPKFTYYFHKLYKRESDSYEYTNPCTFSIFSLEMAPEIEFGDYLFLCPLWNNRTRDVQVFFITKEYNVAAFEQPYKPGRFVIGDLFPGPTAAYNNVILAEEPAHVRRQPDFNIERYYLQIRNHVQQAKSDKFDPLCKLLSGDMNQSYRLCVAVCRSSYLRKEFNYPDRAPFPCIEKEISFRTKEAQEKVTGKSFYERVTLCHASPINPKDRKSLLYISRGYRSNRVFVYRHYYTSDATIYLENLSVDISIVDELNSFDFVEE